MQRVNAVIEGRGLQEIGTIKIAVLIGRGALAEFRLHPEFRWLDACYDFRWVNVEERYLVDGVEQTEDPVVGRLPAIDPRAFNPRGSNEGINDSSPLYNTDEALKAPLANGRVRYAPGVLSVFTDLPSDTSQTDSEITFTTHLVAVRTINEFSGECEQAMRPRDLGALAGFRWIYVEETTTATIDGFLDDDSFELIIDALNAGEDDIPPHLGNPGFPGWDALHRDSFMLCECTNIDDHVSPSPTPPDDPFVTMGPTFLLDADGVVIEMTFPNGVTPLPEKAQTDTAVFEEPPVSLQWSADIEDVDGLDYQLDLLISFGLRIDPVETELTVGIDFMMIPQDEPLGFGPIGIVTELDLENRTYRIEFDREGGGEPEVYEGSLEDYPYGLPPELRLVPISRWHRIIGSTELLNCLGDLDNNGTVNGADLAILLGQWAKVGLADLNIDGIVDGADLAILLGLWGNCACGTSTTGSCFVAHDAPFCSDEDCCVHICEFAPDCCELGWDAGCVSLARSLCVEPPSAPCETPSRLLLGKPTVFELWQKAIEKFHSPDLKGCDEPGGPVEGGNLQWDKGAHIITPPCGSSCQPPACPSGSKDILELNGYFSDEGEPGTQPRIGIMRLTPELVPGSNCDPPGVLECPVEQLGAHGDGFTFRAEFDVTDPDSFNSFYVGGSEVEVLTVTWSREYCVPDPQACCVPGSEPGCPSDPTCEQAVCEFDSFCCDTLWDDTCAVVAALLCSQCEGQLACDEGDCCSEHKTPGCSDPACCELVCTLDPFCCGALWDSFCVFKANALCTVCGGGVPCGDGDCCTPNDSAGCDDPLCCALVCKSLPDCCDVLWDETCAEIATSLCPACSGGG